MIIRRRKSVYWQQQYNNNKQKYHRPPIYVHRHDDETMPQNLYFTPRNDIMIRVDFFNELFFFFTDRRNFDDTLVFMPRTIYVSLLHLFTLPILFLY